MSTATVKNWFGGITSSPHTVVEVTSVEQIIDIVKDTEHYPGPVRAIGSNHSTTACGTADDGTMIVTRKMDKILSYGEDTVTVQAGALYIDVNEELAKRGKQFYVNVELGNLTIGSACCGGTKDASMPGEFGQIASYAVGIKMVLPNGDLLRGRRERPGAAPGGPVELRTVRHRLRGHLPGAPAGRHGGAPREVHARRVRRQLPELRDRDESMMLYINPFKDTITVEFRRYHEASSAGDLSTWQWKLRNEVWSHFAPLWGHNVSRLFPSKWIRSALTDFYNGLIVLALTKVIKGKATLPIAQQIRYPEVSGNDRYLFSIWAFPEERYIDCLGPTTSSPRSTTSAPATGSTCSASATASSPTRARCSPTASTARSSPSTRSPRAPSAGTPSCASTTRCAATSAAPRCSTRPTC